MATAYDLINRTIIKAPFDGVITERYKSIGERVDLNDENQKDKFLFCTR